MESAVSNVEKDQGRILSQQDAGVAARYRLNDIFCHAWLSQAISAVAHYQIPDLLKDEPRAVADIAQQCGLHAPTLARVLRALAHNGIFVECEQGYIAHNEASQLLRAQHPYSWRGMALMWNHPSCLQAWQALPEVLKDGRSGIEHAFGKPLYQHLHDSPAATQAFADAMISNSAHASESIARGFPFQQYRSVADLGGGVGTLLATLLAAHPHLTGLLYEIDDLQQAGQQYLAERGLSDRAQVMAGNFLEHVPAEWDLYLVKNSLWNWDDEHCLAIMKNVRAAIGRELARRFIVIEYIIEPENAVWTTVYDLQILNMPGGRARTLAEYQRLLEQAGFQLTEKIYLEDQTLLVACPK